MNFSRFRIAPLAGAVILGITGCIGGSDDDSSTPVQLSGVVADGYLENALVCLDLNLNKACDTNEPQASTDVDGKYTFETNTSDASIFPVISIITANTKDADDPTRTLQPYVMSAPAGKHEFVSPMTTMIQTQLESNPALSVEEAESSVKTNLGYAADSAVSLFKDYVAAQQDTTDVNKDEYKRIHRVAQVTARALEANHTTIQTAAEDAGLDTSVVLDELVRLVVKEVIAELSTIATQVDANESNFDADTVTTAVNISVDTTEIEDDVAAEEAVSEAKTIDITALLTAGIFDIDSDRDETTGETLYEIGEISLGTDGTSLEFSDTEWNGTDWVASVDDSGSTEEVRKCQDITSTGIVTYTCSDNETIVDNGDGTASLTYTDAAGNVIAENVIKGIEVPLAGKRMRGTFGGDEDMLAWYQAIPGSAIFGANAKGYRWSFATKGDQYTIAYDEAETGSTCSDDRVTDSVNCHAIFTASNTSPTGDGVAALADGTTIYYIGPGIGVKFTADATDSTMGTANFIVQDVASDLTGSFSITQPHGSTVDVLLFDVPRELRSDVFDGESAKLFFVEESSYLRIGKFVPGGVTENDDEFTYDANALADIKACFQGGTSAGTCAVELVVKDPRTKDADGAVIVSFDTSKTMVPYLESDVPASMSVFTEASGTTDARWNFTFATDGTGTFEGFDSTTGVSNGVKSTTWKITPNGRLKVTRYYSGGQLREDWIVTNLSDDTVHLRRKRQDGTKDFGGFITIQ